jgi:hypothetical protein
MLDFGSALDPHSAPMVSSACPWDMRAASDPVYYRVLRQVRRCKLIRDGYTYNRGSCVAGSTRKSFSSPRYGDKRAVPAFPILNEPPVISLKWGKPLIRSGESWAKRILSARTDFRAAIVISLFADSQHSDWATIIAYGIDPSRVFSGHAETHYPPRLSKWLSVSCTVGLATHQRPPRSILIGGSGEAQVPWKYRLVAIAL